MLTLFVIVPRANSGVNNICSIGRTGIVPPHPAIDFVIKGLFYTLCVEHHNIHMQNLNVLQRFWNLRYDLVYKGVSTAKHHMDAVEDGACSPWCFLAGAGGGSPSTNTAAV